MKGVVILLEDTAGKYLFLKDRSGLLDFPTGAMRVNEGPTGAASRILRKATGISIPPTLFETAGPSVYTATYTESWGTIEKSGNKAWLSAKELRDIRLNKPELLSPNVREACDREFGIPL